MRRLLALSLTVMGFTIVAPSAAWAAGPPPNDTVAGATVISSLPFSDAVDVSQATTDSNDAALNAQCGAPVTDNSIWYKYTATGTEGGLVADVSQSDYSSGAIIAEGGPGNWTVDSCGPGATGTPVVAGTTYYILAFNDTPGQTGGFIRINVTAQPLPTLSVTVNRTGKVDKFGNATVSGTLTCTNASAVQIQTSLTQNVGRFQIQGAGFSGLDSCTGSAEPWSAVVAPSNGKFAGGKSANLTFAFGCGNFFCASNFASTTVKLSK